ncbi:MAG: alanine racemase [Treponema sp.]|jgi:alanine racemase|nr:alanine racemase [Treponema sp.]
MRGTRAIIHLDHLTWNIGVVRKIAGSERLICLPVKADAYGHGAVWVAKTALKAGVRYLAVATVHEGKLLRDGGIDAPILLLSIPLPEEIPDVVANGLIPLVTDQEFAAALANAAKAAGRQVQVHLKIDTGMGRVGVSPDKAVEAASFIKSRDFLVYAGTATHLAVSESTAVEDISFTKQQILRFKETVDSIKKAGIDPGIVHSANSGAVILHQDSWFDMIRPGIMIYGYAPVALEAGPLTGNGKEADLRLKPVMELSSRVVFIKKVKKGESISYGRKWTALVDSWIATIPIGYGDGLPRALGGYLSIKIRDNFYPLVGRICMDQCMINLGPETDIKRWDEVTIFGGKSFTAADLAEELGTIPYEITCNINKRVPRVYIK